MTIADCGYPLVVLLPNFEIIWLSNLSILSVPAEGYSSNALCALNLISIFCTTHQSHVHYTLSWESVPCYLFMTWLTVMEYLCHK
jgi:hypothetical protein